MSIEVHVNTSVSLLRTCIKFLHDHIRCTEHIVFWKLSSMYTTLSISPTYCAFLSNLSIKPSLWYYVATQRSRLFVKFPHAIVFTITDTYLNSHK